MKKPIIFIGGVIVGAAVGIAATYKYFEKQYDNKIREYYAIFSKENFEENIIIKEVDDKKDPDEKSEKKPETKVILNPTKTQVERREELNDYNIMAGAYKAEPFDYAGLSRPKVEDLDPAELVGPSEDDDDVEFYQTNDPNYIVPIDSNMWESATGYKKVYVQYFKGDDTFVEEDTGVVFIPEERCGREVLNRLGEQVPNMAYSRNVEIGEEYAVFRYFGTYEEDHA